MRLESNVLLDCFAPPQKAGSLISFLGSTYEFDTEFLQKDLVPTLLSLGTRSQDQTITPTALDSAVSQCNLGIVLDHNHYGKGWIPQRVDIVAPAQKQHSKVYLIHWQNCVRAIITSANLTTSGCRKNREVASVLNFSSTDSSNIASLRDISAGFRSHFESAMTSEMKESLENALKVGENFARGASRNAGPKILWGGGNRSLLSQIVDLWPKNDRVESLHIVSPFWPSDGSAPFDTLHDLLASKGCLRGQTHMDIYCSGVGGLEASTLPEFPYEAKGFLQRWSGCKALLHPVDNRVLKSDVPDEFGEPSSCSEGRRDRPLHAKIIGLVGERHILVAAGSANFTVNGLLALNANVEAQAVWLLPRPTREAWFAKNLLPPINGSIDLESCVPQNLSTAPLPDSPRPWPVFIDKIELALDRPIFEWSDVGEVASLIVTHRMQENMGGATTISVMGFTNRALTACSQVPWQDRFRLDAKEAKQLLMTREVNVIMPGVSDPISFPVNLTSASKAMIPIQNLTSPLTEDQLILFYKGMVSADQLAEVGPTTGNDRDSTPGNDTIDPAILQVYKVREFIESLPGLQEELKNSTKSTQSMRRAFLAEVSPIALGNAILCSYNNKERTWVASAFQLLQLIDTVDHVPIGRSDKTKHEIMSECLKRLQEVYAKIRETAGSSLKEEAFQKFESAMLKRRIGS